MVRCVQISKLNSSGVAVCCDGCPGCPGTAKIGWEPCPLLHTKRCRSQHHSRGGEGDYYELMQPAADPLIRRCLLVSARR